MPSSKEFDLIADGDKEVKCFFVVPSSTSLCIFTSKDATIFDNDTNRFYQKYGANLLLLSESHFFRYKLNEIRNRHQLVKSASQLSTAAFSELIGFSINCQYFKPPISEEPRLNKPLSIMVDTPKGIEAALTSDVPIRSEQPKKAFITYAQLMSSVLTVRKSTLKEPEMKFISFFIENNVLDVFGCTKSKFTEWITHVFSFYDDNNIDALKKFECSVFVRKLFFAKKWEDWFSKEEKIVIILIVFLSDISKCWRCKVDDDLVNIFNELKCRPISGLFCSILFGKGFGIVRDSLSLTMKKMLIGYVDNYVCGDTARDLAEVTANVRGMSLQGFKLNSKNKMWLGRALVLISSLQNFAELNENLVEQISKEMDDTDKRKLIFRIERVFLPMLTCMSQRNEVITQILSNIRSALKILHSKLA